MEIIVGKKQQVWIPFLEVQHDRRIINNNAHRNVSLEKHTFTVWFSYPSLRKKFYCVILRSETWQLRKLYPNISVMWIKNVEIEMLRLMVGITYIFIHMKIVSI